MNNEKIGIFRLDLTDTKYIVTFMKYKKRNEFSEFNNIR